ncbi:MAG TPA: cysteine synthase family protein [Terriglobales bacterium]|nr:cysteine synthase family protein [Terriglobales bacterium]
MLGASLTDRIGNTPLLRVELESGPIYAKAEWHNPGGSVKDRAAWRMVAEGESSGRLTHSHTILEATSGNTGIALAMLGAARGYKVQLALPANVSPERKRILAAFGPELTYTDPGDGTDGAILRARQLHAAAPERYFYTDQYSNPANWQAHYHGTAEEIWRQTDGRVTHFIAALGTSGTFVGTARRLKELRPGIRCISLQPDSPLHGIEGTKHMASALVPAIYDPTVADEDRFISTEAAYEMVKLQARQHGLLIGVSGGAALAAAAQLRGELGPDALVVTVLPDNADKYLSEKFWEIQ